MDLLERLERIKYIDDLILTRRANSVKELAKKLNTSRRQILRQIKLMRKIGAPLLYDKRSKKYYYTEEKKFIFKYE